MLLNPTHYSFQLHRYINIQFSSQWDSEGNEHWIQWREGEHLEMKVSKANIWSALYLNVIYLNYVLPTKQKNESAQWIFFPLKLTLSSPLYHLCHFHSVFHSPPQSVVSASSLFGSLLFGNKSHSYNTWAVDGSRMGSGSQVDQFK